VLDAAALVAACYLLARSRELFQDVATHGTVVAVAVFEF